MYLVLQFMFQFFQLFNECGRGCETVGSGSLIGVDRTYKRLQWMVCFSALHSHSGEFLIPHLCKKSAHLPCDVRILLSVHHRLRCKSNPVGVCPGGILYRRWSFSTAVSHVYFQLVIMSKFVSIRSIAVFNEGFLDFNRFLIASSI